MNKISIAISAVCTVIVVLFTVIFMFTNNNYVPICELLTETENIDFYSCTEIKLKYEDLSGNGMGKEKEITVTDKASINEICDKFINTFCKKTNNENYTGSTNVDVTLKFGDEDEEKIVNLFTYSYGTIKIGNTYYKTNNMFGSYISDYVLNN